MAKVEQLYASKLYYRVVYLDGLGKPVEALIGASEALNCDSGAVLESVCHFIQQGIDMDCRRVLFIYRDIEAEHAINL